MNCVDCKVPIACEMRSFGTVMERTARAKELKPEKTPSRMRRASNCQTFVTKPIRLRGRRSRRSGERRIIGSLPVRSAMRTQNGVRMPPRSGLTPTSSPDQSAARFGIVDAEPLDVLRQEGHDEGETEEGDQDRGVDRPLVALPRLPGVRVPARVRERLTLRGRHKRPPEPDHDPLPAPAALSIERGGHSVRLCPRDCKQQRPRGRRKGRASLYVR